MERKPHEFMSTHTHKNTNKLPPEPTLPAYIYDKQAGEGRKRKEGGQQVARQNIKLQGCGVNGRIRMLSGGGGEVSSMKPLRKGRWS